MYYVGEVLAIGAVLLVVVLFAFPLQFRTTLITLTAIPLSLMTTALVFRLIELLTGEWLSINVMTLSGIAVAMGESVDDAIVDVENIVRRWRENQALSRPRPALRVVYEASVEIRGAIVFGTLVVILAVLSLFALAGVEGRLFTPLAITYIASILASLAGSLTLTPVLCYYLSPHALAMSVGQEDVLIRLLKHGARHVISLSLRRVGPLLGTAWLLVGLCVWQPTRIGADFLPPFDEWSVQINLALPPGSSLQAPRMRRQ